MKNDNYYPVKKNLTFPVTNLFYGSFQYILTLTTQTD